MRRKKIWLSALFLGLLSLAALAAPLLAPYDPNLLVGPFRAAPTAQFLLGTDLIGRDVLSRLIYAARVSCGVALGAVTVSSLVGVSIGLLSGWLGGFVDSFLMRVTDVFMSFPDVMLLLVFLAVFGSGAGKMVLLLGLISWPATARVMRAATINIRHEPYLVYASVSGYPSWRIAAFHILPNVAAPLAVNITNAVASAVLAESSLSFLGLGVMPPTASWGTMLSDGQSLSVLLDSPWIWLPPGLMILFTLLALRSLSDGIAESL